MTPIADTNEFSAQPPSLDAGRDTVPGQRPSWTTWLYMACKRSPRSASTQNVAAKP